MSTTTYPLLRLIFLAVGLRAKASAIGALTTGPKRQNGQVHTHPLIAVDIDQRDHAGMDGRCA